MSAIRAVWHQNDVERRKWREAGGDHLTHSCRFGIGDFYAVSATRASVIVLRHADDDQTPRCVGECGDVSGQRPLVGVGPAVSRRLEVQIERLRCASVDESSHLIGGDLVEAAAKESRKTSRS
ncbi:hypothetical protein ASD16_09370 [Cellulomonas sp. Root485]|nr:hypothetical protein ASD16_09370 [Cellulomonas sp. Root485]